MIEVQVLTYGLARGGELARLLMIESRKLPTTSSSLRLPGPTTSPGRLAGLPKVSQLLKLLPTPASPISKTFKR